MRPTCPLFPNMRLRGHNLDFRGCDKGTFATVDVFFFSPCAFFCASCFCIKCSRVNICTSMCDTTLVCAVQLPLRHGAWREHGDHGQESSSCLEVCFASAEEDVEVGRDNLFVGQIKPLTHMCGPLQVHTYGDKIWRLLKWTEICWASSELGSLSVPFHRVCGGKFVSTFFLFLRGLQ